MSDRMLPKLNRNASMMPTTNTTGGYYSIKNDNNGYHSLNGVLDSSPLKLFSRAKQSINTIYHEFYVFLCSEQLLAQEKTYHEMIDST